MNVDYLAQRVCIGFQCVDGPLPSNISTIGDVVNQVTKFLVPFAAIILLLVLIWGGYDYILSQGNPEKLKGAQAKITSGIIGFILLIVSYLFVKLISLIFGLGGGII